MGFLRAVWFAARLAGSMLDENRASFEASLREAPQDEESQWMPSTNFSSS